MRIILQNSAKWMKKLQAFWTTGPQRGIDLLTDFQLYFQIPPHPLGPLLQTQAFQTKLQKRHFKMA